MRDLTKVISDVLKVVPDEYSSLRNRLIAIRESSAFTSPELMYLRWRMCGSILDDEIGVPYHDWEFDVERIFYGLDTHSRNPYQ